ncbi:unnamed protein product [Candidula unifasciata]|uniref:Uncharacterized protein n=1 Tax=Candidula unifasciata TaxID=100452 RepID=A0A8S3Z5F5_9EUPU|nr:unnamed protein product [Candidula unifasciata]
MYKVEDSVCGGYRSFRDIAILERLLEADDEFIANELLNKEIRAGRWQKNGFPDSNIDGTNCNVSDINNRGRNNSGHLQKCREVRAIQLCGWHSDPNVVYRKTENGGMSKSKLAAGSLGKDAPLPRDSKSKTFSSEDFVFQHYLDTSHYIEQYRQKHRCSDKITLSPARSDLSDLRKPQQNPYFSPMTIFSQTIYQQEASMPSSQLEDLLVQNQTQNKSSQATTNQLANKREQLRQKLQMLKNFKKTFSPPIGTYDTSKVKDIPESVPSSSHLERTCSMKEMVLIPAIIDTPFSKATAGLLRVQTLNIDSLPNKNARLLKPGPVLDTVTGNNLLGHRVGLGATNQMRMLDATAFRLGSGNEKQSSWSQKVSTCFDAHMGPTALANEQEYTSKPVQLVMTSQHQEGHPQTLGPDLSQKVQVSQLLDTKSRGSYRAKNSIEMVALANSLLQRRDEINSRISGKTAKQNMPQKEHSLLTVVGHDCRKTREFVCDHLAIARKHNNKLLLSHNQRIQNIIEQSKLKQKFDQILNMPKGPSKTILEIKSIQITDPFVKAVPGNGPLLNLNNSCKAEQSVFSPICFCVVNCKNNNNENSYSRKAVPGNGQILVNSTEATVHDGEEESCSNSSNSDSTQRDMHEGSHIISLTTSTAGLEYSNPQTTHADFSFAENIDVKTQVGQGFCAACGHILDVCPPKSKLKQACLHKSYFHRLTKEVQKMEVRLPELRYLEVPLVCRSHSLDL